MSRNVRHGEAPSVRAASSTRGSSVDHEPAHRAHHHRVVEEDVGDQDRPDRAGEVDAHDAGGAEDPEQGDADDDRGQHERHEQRGPQEPFADEPIAGEERGAGQADQHAQHAWTAAACQRVNQATRRITGSVTTSARAPSCHWPSGRRPRRTMAATGQTKKTARNASGGPPGPAATTNVVSDRSREAGHRNRDAHCCTHASRWAPTSS